MSIKSLGISLWSSPKPSSPTPPRRNSQIEVAPIGFGLPSPEDPDPFGVRALELAGLEIKEAGSSIRPSIDAFEYRPSPTSPIFRLSTQSLDLAISNDSKRNSKRDSKRNSKRSLFSLRNDRTTPEPRNSISEGRKSISDGRNSISESRPSLSESRISSPTPPTLPPRDSVPASSVPSPTIATFAIDAGIVSSPVTTEHSISRSMSLKSTHIHLPETIDETIEEESDGEISDFDDEEDIIIEEVSTSTIPAIPTVLAMPVAVQAKVVSIKKRGPPALPMKSPLRPRFFGASAQDELPEDQDENSSTYSLSPDKDSFDKIDDAPNPWSEQTSLQDNESVHNKDIGRDSLSASEHGSLGKDSVTDDKDKVELKDSIETVIVSEPLPASHTVEITKEPAAIDIAAEQPAVAMGSVPSSPVEQNHETQPISEHKSNISGSTLASIIDTKAMVKSSSEQSLANLIQQGLRSTLADEDEYADAHGNEFYDAEEASSDYEDDKPVSPVSPIKDVYVTPGAFEPEIIH